MWFGLWHTLRFGDGRFPFAGGAAAPSTAGFNRNPTTNTIMSLTKALKLSGLIAGVAAGALLPSTAQAAGENVSGSLSLDFNSHFMSYGFNVWGANTEDIGDEILFQPSAGLSFALNEGSAIYTGVWADVNDLATSSIADSVQEIDVWVGYYFTVGKFKIDFTLQSWMYASETEGIFDVTVSYDTMFSPYVKFHNRFETVTAAQNKGTIIEIGGTAYSTTVGPVSLSVPVAAAFAPQEYHVAGEEGYVYSYTGVKFTLPLGIPESYGVWDIHGSVLYYDTEYSTTGNAETGYLTAGVGIGLAF